MKNYINIGKKLFPIHRSLTGKGNIKSLKILKKDIKNLKIKNYKSGEKVFDWKIPYEWNVKQAYVKDKYGKKLIDLSLNNLHLVSYSVPINKNIKKKELLKHLHFYKKQKNAIPYVTSFYKKYWGFCLTYINFLKIKKNYSDNDNFIVKIDSKFKKNGKLTFGELFIKGREKKEILITCNICHPSMANNELSGPLVTSALAKHFGKIKTNKKSLRFLFLPETIGAIAFIKKNFKSLKKNVIGGYHITCAGDNRVYSYLYSKYHDSPSDKAAIKAFKDLKIKLKKYKHIHSESEARRFNAPNINFGTGEIMRSKYHSFPEYHTSLDNFNVVTAKGLSGTFKVAKRIIENLMEINTSTFLKWSEKRKIKRGYIKCKTFCEPNLGKRKLYPLISRKDNSFKEPVKLLDFLQYADGTNNLRNISKLVNLSMKKTSNIYKILMKAKVVKKI